MAAVLTVALVTAVAFGLGNRILRGLGVRDTHPAEAVAFSVGLGYGAVAYVVFGVGLVGALHPWVLAGLLVLAALWSAREGRAGVAAVRGAARAATASRHAFTFTIGALLLLCALANLVAALAPPTGGDALSYHLAVPKIWLAEHRITEVPWRWPSYGPFTLQMLYMLGMGLQGVPAPSVFAWMTGILTAVALLGAGARFPRAFPALLPAGVFYTMSTVAQGSSTTRIDLGLTLYVTLAILAAVNYLRTRQTSWVLVAGMCAGLAAGTKYTGAAAVAVLAVGLYAFGGDRSTAGSLRPAAVFAMTAAIVVAPWYARSFFLTGDPIYPFLTALRGNQALRAQLVDLGYRYGLGKNLTAFFSLPLYVTAAIGAPYLSFAPFSLALWHRAKVRFLYYAIAALAAVWFVTAQAIRFLLPALPAAAIVAGLGFGVLEGRSRLLRTVARAAVVIGLTVATAITLRHDAGFAPVVFGLQSPEAFLLQAAPNQADVAWMNAHLPADARVLFFARSGFYLQRAYIGASAATVFGDLRRWVADHHISHIYCQGTSCERVSRSGIGIQVLFDSTARMKLRQGRDRSARPVISRVLRVTAY